QKLRRRQYSITLRVGEAISRADRFKLTLEEAHLTHVAAGSGEHVEELFVAVGLPKLVEQLFGCARRTEIGVFRNVRPHASQGVDTRQHVGSQQQFFTASR